MSDRLFSGLTGGVSALALLLGCVLDGFLGGAAMVLFVVLAALAIIVPAARDAGSRSPERFDFDKRLFSNFTNPGDGSYWPYPRPPEDSGFRD